MFAQTALKYHTKNVKNLVWAIVFGMGLINLFADIAGQKKDQF